jgi:hypothetical protein
MGGDADIAAEIMAAERNKWQRPIGANGEIIPAPVAPLEAAPARVESTPPLFGERDLSQPQSPEKTMRPKLDPAEKKRRQLQYQRDRRERLAREQGREYKPRGKGKETPMATTTRPPHPGPLPQGGEGGGIAGTLANLRAIRAAWAGKVAALDQAIALLEGT